MHDDHMEVKDIDIRDEESFEKLILAYDYSTRRNSKYKVIERDDKLIDNGSYRYPALLGTFFALVGFILLVLFSRKYETARQHV